MITRSYRRVRESVLFWPDCCSVNVGGFVLISATAAHPATVANHLRRYHRRRPTGHAEFLLIISFLYFYLLSNTTVHTSTSIQLTRAGLQGTL